MKTEMTHSLNQGMPHNSSTPKQELFLRQQEMLQICLKSKAVRAKVRVKAKAIVRAKVKAKV